MTPSIPRPILYAFAGLLASQLALSGASILVASKNTERANHQWCTTLRVFRESYEQTPPQTQTGRDIRDGLNGVYDAYHCDRVRGR